MPRLKVGDRAPDFSATTQDDSTIRLSDFVGERGLALAGLDVENGYLS